MKIMYCITSSSWGGAQLHVLELCKDQIKRGNKVVFVVGSSGPLLTKVRQIKGVKVILLPTLKKKISPTNDIKSIIKLHKLLRKEKPDILHLHSSKAGTIGRVSALGLHKQTKVIFTVHGWAFTDGVPSKLKKKLYKIIERMVSPLTDLFICVSAFDKNIGIRDKVLKKNSNALVIHNGSAMPTNKNDINFSCHKPIRFVMIARFAKQKNQKMLIEAIKELPKEKYILTFVGDGETLPDCKKMVNKYDLNSNVFFSGFKDDVKPFLIHNDVYILTSHYEGLPISIIEAMSFGLPIIASDVGGNSEMVVNEENGFLINDPIQLRRVLLYLIDNPEKIKLMGEKSYQIYLDNYRLEDNMDKINSAYKRLLSV